MSYFLFAFESTHTAMAIYKALSSLEPAIIPTPCSINASCGMSLRFEAEDAHEAQALIPALGATQELVTLYYMQEGNCTLVQKW